MNYHIAKKHSTATQLLELFTNAKYMTKLFTAFTYCENIKNECGTPRGSRAQIVDLTQLMGEVDDKGLEEEKEICKLSLWTLRCGMGDKESLILP